MIIVALCNMKIGREKIQNKHLTSFMMRMEKGSFDNANTSFAA